MFKKAIYIVVLMSSRLLFCQQTLNQHIENELDKLYKEEYNKKKEIKYEGKRYRIYSNYLTLGAGKGFNTGWNDLLFTSALDFNFHLQKRYYQFGGLLQGPSYGDNKLIQFHLSVIGYRKESYKYFWAIFGGLSYTDGYKTPIMLKDKGGKDSLLVPVHVKEIGIYTAIQLFYKPKFDYGLGLTIFGDVNQKQSIIGLRLELFFSGAFRGSLKRKEDY